MSERTGIQEMLVSMGFQNNYIQRAFKVYEKNYGHSYNVEVITEIIVRLQNKDKQKGKKEQSTSPNKGKSPSKQPSSNKKSPSKNKSQSQKVPKHAQSADAQQVHIQSSSSSSNGSSKARGGGMGGGNKGPHSPQITVKTDPPPKAYSGSNYGGSSNAKANSPVPSTPPSNMRMDKREMHRSSSGGGSARNSNRKQPRSSPNGQSDYNHSQSPYSGNQRQGQHTHSLSSQIQSPFTQQPQYKKGDIVVYGNMEVEVMRVMGQMVEITYPIQEFILQRRNKTVNIGDLQPQSPQTKRSRHGQHGHSQQYSGQHSPRNNPPSHHSGGGGSGSGSGLSRHHHGHTYSKSQSQSSSMGSGGIPSIHQINGNAPSRPRNAHGLHGHPDAMRQQQSAPQHHGHNNSRHPPSKTPPPNLRESPNKSRVGPLGQQQQQQININMNAVNLNASNKVNQHNDDPMQPDDVPTTSKMPLFSSHMTLQDAFKLKIHDKIDHRDQVGRFVFATVSEKQGTNLKIHYDGWSRKWDTWSDFAAEIHRFAVAGSISKRKAHRFEHLKKGDYVDLNPTQRHPGWKCGEIRRLDQKSGQVQVVYESMDKNYLYWAHLDNVAEIAEFTSKSGTVHATQVEMAKESGIGGHSAQKSGSSMNSQRNQPSMNMDHLGHGLKGRGGGGGSPHHHGRSGSAASGMNAPEAMDEMEAYQRIRAKRFPRGPMERIKNKYGIGDWLEVQDSATTHWITATVIDRENNWIVVHFDGWPSKYDQKIHVVKHGKRLRDLGSGLQETQEEKDIKEEMASFRAELETKAWELEVVDADGNCLYRCFGKEIYGDSGTYKRVRAECCLYMRQNEEFFSNFIPDFELRMKEKEQDYEWGDHVDITALSELYNVRVRVFEYDQQQRKLYMSFDQGEHPDTAGLPLILLARHRKKHYNIIHDPKAVHQRHLGDAKSRHSANTVSLRTLRLNEDAKVEEHGDDEKENGHDDEDHVHEHNEMDIGSLRNSKSISRHNSNHSQFMSHRVTMDNDTFSLFLTEKEFESVLELYNISGPLERNDLRSIFGPLMKLIHKKIEYQWENDHVEVNKQILDRFWSSKYEQQQEAHKNCKKWIDSLREKIPSGQYPVNTANTTFNQVIVAPMSSNLGHIVKTRKRQSTIDPYRAQLATQQMHSQNSNQSLSLSQSHEHGHRHHPQQQQQSAMDLDD